MYNYSYYFLESFHTEASHDAQKHRYNYNRATPSQVTSHLFKEQCHEILNICFFMSKFFVCDPNFKS